MKRILRSSHVLNVHAFANNTRTTNLTSTMLNYSDAHLTKRTCAPSNSFLLNQRRISYILSVHYSACNLSAAICNYLRWPSFAARKFTYQVRSLFRCEKDNTTIANREHLLHQVSLPRYVTDTTWPFSP